MSTKVEERVVEMRFDNAQFERNIAQSTESLEKLKTSLQLDDATRSFDEIEKAAKGLNLSGITDKLEDVKSNVGAFGQFTAGVFAKLGWDATSTMQKIFQEVSSFSLFGQMLPGFAKNDEITQAMQTIVAAGYNIDDVAKTVQKLNWYTDETSYSLTDMVSSIGKFTAQGVDLETAATAMEGISNWAARSGMQVQEAQRAMYNLSQSLAQGTVKLMDWKSIENANMATAEFKKTVLETAAAQKVLKKQNNDTYIYLDKSGKKWKEVEVTVSNFGSTLSHGWFTKDVLIGTLEKYGSATDKLNEIYNRTGISATKLLSAVQSYKEGQRDFSKLAEDNGTDVDYLNKAIAELSGEEYKLGIASLQAAQEALTLDQALKSVKDAASTSWSGIFQAIFGNYNEAKGLWTNVANDLYDIFVEPVNALKNRVTEGFKTNYEKLEDELIESGADVDAFRAKIIELGVASGAISEDIVKDGKLTEGSLSDMFYKGTLDANIIKQALWQLGEETSSVGGAIINLGGIVRRVIRGDFGNNAARVKALTEAGYDYETVQNLVNKALNQGVTDFENWSEAQLKSAGFSEEEISIFKQLSNEAGKYGSTLDELISSVNDVSGRGLFAEAIDNYLSGIATILEVIADAWEEAFPSDGSGIAKFLEILHRGSEIFLEWAENSEALRTSIAFIVDVIKSIGIVIRTAFRVASRLVGSLVKLFVRLAQKVKESKDELVDTSDQLKPLSWIIEKIAEAIEWVVDEILGAKIVQDIFMAIGSALNWVFGIASSVIGWVTTHLSGVPGLIASIWGWLTRLFNKIIENEKVQQIWENFTDKVEEFAENAGELIEPVIEKLTTFFDTFGEREDSGGIFDGFVESVTTGFENLKKLFEGKWWTIDLSNLLPKVDEESVEQLKANFWSFFTGDIEEGQTVVATMANMSTAMKDLGNAAKGNTGPITQAISSFGDSFLSFTEDIDFEKLFEKTEAAVVGMTTLGVSARMSKTLQQGVEGITAITSAFSSLISKAPDVNPAIKSFAKLEDAIAARIEKQKFIDTANGIFKIALAIAILAGSLWVMSRLKPEEMQQAIDGLIAIVSSFAMLMLAFGAISKYAAPTAAGIATLVAIPVAILLFAGAFALLAQIKWSEKGVNILFGILSAVFVCGVIFMAADQIDISFRAILSLVTIPFVLAEFAGALMLLSLVDWRKWPAMLTGIATAIVLSMVVFALADEVELSFSALAALAVIPFVLAEFAGAMMLLSLVDWRRWPAILAGIGAAVVMIGFIMNIVSTSNLKKNSEKAAGILIATGIALMLIAKAFQIMMSIEDFDVVKFGVIVFAMLAFIEMFSRLIASTEKLGKNSGKAVGTLLAMGVAMVMIAGSMILIATQPLEKIGAATLAITLIIAMMSLLVYASSNSKDAAKTIYAMATTMGVLVGLLALVSLIEDQESVLRATGCISALMLMFSLLLATTSLIKNNKSWGPLLAMAAVIAVMAGALYFLAEMPAEGMLAGAIALSVLIGVIAGAVYLLSGVGKASLTGIASFAGTLLSVGMTAMFIGAGLFLAAEAINKFIDAYERIDEMTSNSNGLETVSNSMNKTLDNGFVKKMPGIISAIDSFATGVAEGIVSIARIISENAVVIIDAIVGLVSTLLTRIVMVIPQLLTLVTQLISMVCMAITINFPIIITTIVNMLLVLLSTIASNMDRFVMAGANIAINFLNGLAEALPAIVQAGVNLVLALIHAIADALRGNGAATADALIDLFSGALEGLKSLWEVAKQKGKEIIDKILEAITGHDLGELLQRGRDMIDKIKDGIKEFDFLSIGSDIIQGLIDGLRNNPLVSKLMDAGKWLAEMVHLPFAGEIESNSPSKLFERYGKYIDEGLIIGVRSMGMQVQQTGEELGKMTFDSVTDGVGDISSVFGAPGLTPVNGYGQFQNAALSTAGAMGISGYADSLTRMAGRSTSTVNNNQPTFNIYQQPGQDPQDLARIINRELGRLLVV